MEANLVLDVLISILLDSQDFLLQICCFLCSSASKYASEYAVHFGILLLDIQKLMSDTGWVVVTFN